MVHGIVSIGALDKFVELVAEPKFMPKGIDFRITGLSFEQAGRKLAAAKSPEPQKPTRKKTARNRRKSG